MPRKSLCCVGKCQNLRKDAILYKLPIDEKRLQKWLECLSGVCDTEKLIPGISKVCKLHFEERFFKPNSRLSSNAYPSLFSNEEISTGTSSSIGNTLHLSDHNYARKRHYDHTYAKQESIQGAVALQECSAQTTSLPVPTLAAARETLEIQNVAQQSENTLHLGDHNYGAKRNYDHTYAKHETIQSAVALQECSAQTTSLPVPTLAAARETLEIQNVAQQSENILHLGDHNYTRKRHSDHTYPKEETIQYAVALQECSVQTTSLPVSTLAATPKTLGMQNVAHKSEKTLHLAGLCSSRKRKLSDNKIKKKTVKYQPPRRIISKKRELSPLCHIVFTEYKRAKKQLNFQKRANRALKFSKEVSFRKLSKTMSTSAKTFFQMQTNLSGTKPNARRYSLDEKILALCIFKQSPKCYRFLSKIFVLPTKSTLNAMISKLKIGPGINPQLFNLLKTEVNNWDTKRRLCSLIFDEMSLEAGLTYNKCKDNICGFVELNEKRQEFADHALVFMLRGAVCKWQQPICFYYCQGATSAIEVKNILTEVIKEIIKVGLNPIALICDQGAAFQSAVHQLQEDTKRYQILNNLNPDGKVKIGCAHMVVIFDPSHLIKGVRNNFLNKNILIDGKLSRWQDIVDLYKSDCQHTDSRLLHKLNDQCVIPDKIKKMKVKNCVKVLSSTVAGALNLISSYATLVHGRPSETMKNTAETVKFFDSLFDSINGSSTNNQKNKGKELRKAVTSETPHHTFWPEAIKKLEKMKFIDANGVAKSVPTIKNFIITLKNFMQLWQFFKTMNYKVMRPRYFNSDPIENYFGQVRAYNYRANDPNCYNFACTFKSLIITKFFNFHTPSFNCEDDSAQQVISIKELFKNINNNEELDNLNDKNVGNAIEQARRERLSVQSRAYTAGWVVGKIKKLVHCRECHDSLTSPINLDIHDWISHREYTLAKKRRLNYPSEGAVRCFSTVITETKHYLEMGCHHENLASNIKSYIKTKHSFDFINCAEHKMFITDFFLEVVIKFTIMNWCNIINRILKGTDIIRLSTHNLPKMQKMALEKFKKKLKNKSYNK